MSKTRTWLMLVLSLVLAVTAVSLAARWLQRRDPMALIEVPVAVRDLPAGTRLQEGMVSTVPWPRAAVQSLPPRVEGPWQGRVLSAALHQGEPLLASRLAASGETGGLSAVLSPGKRAVTVKVNEIMGVAGFALPGNQVDVMVHAPDADTQPVSKIVLERIPVLAVAQDVAVGENKPKVVNAVTLEVTPEQAERLDLARSVGTLSLVLRSQADTETVHTPGARKPDLIRTAVLAQAAVTAPRPRPVERRPEAAPSAAPSFSGDAGLQVVRGTRLSLE